MGGMKGIPGQGKGGPPRTIPRFKGGKGPPAAGPPPAGTRLVFKVLLTPDVAAAFTNGTGPGTKTSMERETGIETVLGGEADKYPGTDFTILGLYANEPLQVVNALEQIVALTSTAADEEKQRGPPYSKDGLVGKEPGEFVFRFCMHVAASRALIGVKGVNIQALRKDSNTKIFVENDVHTDQQMCRVIGTVDAIMRCLGEVQRLVHSEAGTPEYDKFCQFLGTPGRTDVSQVMGAAGGGAKGGSAPDGGSRQLLRPKRPASATGKVAQGGPPAKARKVVAAEPVDGAAVDEAVDKLADCIRSLPSGAANLQYQISCEMSHDFVVALSTTLADFGQHVRDMTDTQVTYDPENPETPNVINIVGPLLNVYEAHLLLMTKAEEEELGAQQAAAEEQLRAKEEKLRQEIEAVKRKEEEAKRKLEAERREMELFDQQVERQRQQAEEEERRQAEAHRRQMEAEQRQAEAAEAAAADAAAADNNAWPQDDAWPQEEEQQEEEEEDDKSAEDIAAQIAALQEALNRKKKKANAGGAPAAAAPGGKGGAAGKAGAAGCGGKGNNANKGGKPPAAGGGKPANPGKFI